MLNTLLRYVFYWPIRLTASCKSIPFEPLKEFHIDPTKPICYITVSSSIANLLTIERLTDRLDLPSPFEPVQIGPRKLKRIVYLRRPSFFSSASVKVDFEFMVRQWREAADAAGTDVQIMPIMTVWSRNPGIEGQPVRGFEKPHSSLRKFWTLIYAGGNNCTIMTAPLSLITFTDRLRNSNRPNLMRRAIEIHFRRQLRSITGSPFPNRTKLIADLVARPGTQTAMDELCQHQGVPREEAERQATDIFANMVADTRYPLLLTISKLISFFWRGFFHDQHIDGAHKVRELAQSGHEIIYIPCHRSHMDYVMMFFVIFHEGLPIPVIASGDNLNFFPVGGFIRKCGSYFIRRKMKGDPFYTALFREYLYTLFERGYATEFFIEGGRSRTGRTLPPRTGMVAMTVQAQLRGIERPIAFVPTYLGYEHVMEIGSYMNELSGQKKKKESAMALLGIFKRLRYYGRSYITFGDPIVVPRFLSAQQPGWRSEIDPTGQHRPDWLFDSVNNLAHDIIVGLNDSASVNGINLCALALMSHADHIMSMDLLKNCLRLYITLLGCDEKHLKTLPDRNVEVLISQALELNKFRVYDVGEDVKFVRPSNGQTIQLTYFMNNIVHLFALPALVASIILRNGHMLRTEVKIHTRQLFYFLRHELFVAVDEANLDRLIELYIDTFLQEGYVTENDGTLYISGDGFSEFYVLTSCIRLNLLRYLIAETVLKHAGDHELTTEKFIDDCVRLAKALPASISGGSPEFADPVMFRIMCHTLTRHQYFWIDEDKSLRLNQPKIAKLARAAEPLLRARDARTLDETQSVFHDMEVAIVREQAAATLKETPAAEGYRDPRS